VLKLLVQLFRSLRSGLGRSCLLFGIGISACGGQASLSVGADAGPDAPGRPPLCGDSIGPTAPRVLARGTDLRMESISDNGALVAYSGQALGGLRDLFVVMKCGGDSVTVAERFALGFARFYGSLLVVASATATVDHTPALYAWREGRLGLTRLAEDVDPGSLRLSRNERWLSFEANDRLQDGKDEVDITLVDTATLAARTVAVLSNARARFTRDSEWLVFSGFGAGWGCVQRLSLNDGALHDVGCPDQGSLQGRWEISPDGSWLVYLNVILEEPRAPRWLLARRPLSGGRAEILADGVAIAGGKEFDIARGGRTISYLRDDGSKLVTIPVDGGEPVVLAPQAYSIVDHFESAIAYHAPSVSPVSPDELWVVPSSGGIARNLGPSRYDENGPPGGILEESRGALLVLSADDAVHWLPAPDLEPVLVTRSARDARLAFGLRRHILIQSMSYRLSLYDVETRTTEAIDEAITGPFALDPESRRAFVTTKAVEEGTALILQALRD
jgi:hypothetical protein